MTHLIFVRHAPKEYANRKGPRGRATLDPDVKECDLVFYIKRAIAQIGKVDKIVSSPYLRARRTADAVAEVTGVETSTDCRIGEFLMHQTSRVGEFTFEEETLRRFESLPIFGETFAQLQSRTDAFVSSHKESGDIILVVSHGIVIEYLIKAAKAKKISHHKFTLSN
jgi:broad specificity phosphatase PhoE